MNMKRTALNAALLATFGISTLPLPATAVSLPNGDYDILIATTPTLATTYGGIGYKFGKDGAWNSSFTFGGNPPFSGSQGMTDDTAGRRLVTGTDGVSRGSGIVGDGFAGVIRISVSNNIVAVTSFSKDLIRDTAGGDFVQYYGTGTASIPNTVTSAITGPCGAVVERGSTGVHDLSLMFTNRLGAIAANPEFYNKKWNQDTVTPYNDPNDSTRVVWVPFTTATISNGLNSINGATITSLGDVNADGLTDYSVILVTGARIGNDWGPGFTGISYFEVWNAQIRSVDNSPAVSLASCSIPGIVVATQDPVINAIQTGTKGCSLSSVGAESTDGGAWAIVLAFLAGLRGLMWWRKRNSHNQA